MVEEKRTVAKTNVYEIDGIEQAEFNIQRWIDLIKNYASFDDIDRPLLMALIDNIIVGETKEEDGEKVRDIRIIYNFVGEVSDVC